MNLRDTLCLSASVRLRAVATILLFGAALVPPAVAATIQFELSFGPPSLTDQGDGTVFVEVADCVPLGEPGMPLLPAHPAVVLLSPGETVTAIRIRPAGEQIIDGAYRVAPAQTPRPISAPGPVIATPANADVYGSDALYPAEAARQVTEQHGWGHGLAFLQVRPVAYHPLSGELRWYERITIEVETALAPGASATDIPHLRRTPRVIDRLAAMVVNPQDLALYEGTRAADLSWLRLAPDYYPYVIVTPEQFADDFQPVADFESTRGLRARVVTVEQIAADYPGYIDIQESIRYFIIDAYETWQTEYVLLGGDHDVVEERDLYVSAGGTVDNFPGDCYYEGLDGTWNDDGDSRWGEPGEEDLVGEIAVGRASINTTTELANWFHKNQMYTEQPVVSDVQKALFVGEALDGSTWGGDSMDDVADGASACGYTTVGYPGSYHKERLYERDGNWSKYDLIDLMNDGYPTTHHLGHSNTTYNMKMSNSDTQYFTNDGVSSSYMFNYSQGCYAADFDNNSTDCIVEALVNDDHASAAFISNSRYGWYSPGGVCGPSQHFERQLVDARYDEGITTAGWMNVDSKADCVWMLDPWLRWCHYELNLFGDPAMPQWGDVYGTLDLAHAGAYVIGQGDYEVVVTAGGSPVAGATVTIYSADFGVWASAQSDAYGIALLDPGDLAPMTLYLKGLKADYLPAEDELDAVPPDGPYLLIDEIVYLDAGGDGLVNAGELVQLGLCLRNVGIDTATGVSATLALEDEYVELTTATQTFPDIVPGGEEWADGYYAFSVSPDCPDMYHVTLATTMVADGRPAWDAEIFFDVHAPDMSIYSLQVDDTVGGDGDLHLEAGETAFVTLTLHNAGSGRLDDIAGQLACSHPYVTILSDTGTHAGLGQGESGALAPPFEVAVDPDFSQSDVDFTLALTGTNDYDQLFDVPLPCGGFFETVEAGAGAWVHYVVSGDEFVDQWHVSGQRNHTPGGAQSWKCGDTGAGEYADLLDAGLETPAVEIAEAGQGELYFWHWMAAEVSGSYPGRAYDGGLVEMSVDGGPFVQIEPDGGYPYTIRPGGTPGPFPEDTPVFSGAHDWRMERFDLSTVSGQVVFRFRFGSDGAATEEGWYVDDIEIRGLGSPSDARDGSPLTQRLQLFPSRPNPSSGHSQVALALPEAGHARVEVFDAGGRLVRTLLNDEMPTGYHVVTWTGQDDAGRSVASGLYYFRLSTAQGALQRTTVVLR